MEKIINVTVPNLPNIDEYIEYIRGIWDRNHLTNQGPLVLELQEKLKKYLGAKHLFYVSNGTIALQIAIKVLGLKGDIITTPFSYVATTSSIVWENCNPIFTDINNESLTIDYKKIEKAITSNTKAILATHVYGNPCDIEKIKIIADKYNLYVIYDAAHSFGVKYNDQSLCNFGDISTLSFHATKLFHTIEGGAIVTNDDNFAEKISYYMNFGHKGHDDFYGLGINGKNSEFHAAMGLCNLKTIDNTIKVRSKLTSFYDKNLFPNTKITKPKITENTLYNYGYYPIVFENENTLLAIKDILNKNNIFPRRYFFPSLTNLPYIDKIFDTPISESISRRVLCLPLYNELESISIERICKIILESLN
ncbi:MAG: DegT/DnrJ/EryC1/StrS family aminotransferase [Cyanobacteriota bacterium]